MSEISFHSDLIWVKGNREEIFWGLVGHVLLMDKNEMWGKMVFPFIFLAFPFFRCNFMKIWRWKLQQQLLWLTTRETSLRQNKLRPRQKNTVLNDTSELCVVWDNKCPWLLSQFDLDTVTSDQKHPDMNHTTQYFRASKSYATEVYFYEQQMCS